MYPTVQVTGLDWVRGDEQPLAGTTDVKFRSWEDIALESRERFAADLRVMGLPNSIVDQGLELRDTAAESVHKAVADFWAHHEHRYIETPPDVAEQVTEIYNSARWNAWQRLRDWWLQRIPSSKGVVAAAVPGFCASRGRLQRRVRNRGRT